MALLDRPHPAAVPLTSPRARRRARRVAGWLAVLPLLLLAPVVLLAGAGNPPTACSTSVEVTPTGVPGVGEFAAPLVMAPGQRYAIGATRYGGPTDPSSGTISASGADLAALPDSFAELSVLDTNPATTGRFTFSDANALGELPYNTNLRLISDGRSLVVTKRDIGYGQGPDGQGPGSIVYRLDLWYQAAALLGVSKTAVSAELAPATGSGALLGQLPTSAGGPAATPTTTGCATPSLAGLALTAGPTAQINPATGTAAAPAAAPRAVKLAIAAANTIITTPYLWGGGHADLDQIAAGYDCSGASDYVLHQAGLYPPSTGPASTAMEHVFAPGPGKWITIYANPVHMWLTIAGIVLNTAWYAPVQPTTPPSGPRWQPGSTAAAQIAGNTTAGDPPFIVTHPPGL